jgi:hypothetical protein
LGRGLQDLRILNAPGSSLDDWRGSHDRAHLRRTVIGLSNALTLRSPRAPEVAEKARMALRAMLDQMPARSTQISLVPVGLRVKSLPTPSRNFERDVRVSRACLAQYVRGLNPSTKTEKTCLPGRLTIGPGLATTERRVPVSEPTRRVMPAQLIAPDWQRNRGERRRRSRLPQHM